jgi:arylformamidase
MYKHPVFLSHPISKKTPTYRNKYPVTFTKEASFSNGDEVNHTTIHMTTHVGTHLDMPCHFHENGKSVLDFPDHYWIFERPKILEITPQSQIIKNELIEQIKKNPGNPDILLVKTGSQSYRNTSKYWDDNVGYHPDLYAVIKQAYPTVRLFGFDSISISSVKHSPIGRLAHKEFLNSSHPILPLEDMDLSLIDATTTIKSIIVSPLRIKDADGIPCTVMAFL